MCGGLIGPNSAPVARYHQIPGFPTAPWPHPGALQIFAILLFAGPMLPGFFSLDTAVEPSKTMPYLLIVPFPSLVPSLNVQGHALYQKFFIALCVLLVVPAAAQTFTISPSALTFGQVTIGTSGTSTITLMNTGSTNVTIDSFTLSPSQFQLVQGFAPAVVSPRRTVYFTVSFVPDLVQSFSGQLTLNLEGAGPQIIPLSGTGVTTGAISTLNASTVNFGGVVQGATSAAQTITINNTGSNAFQLLAVNADAPFAVTGFTRAVSVSPGTSISVRVTLRGTQVGSYPRELTLSYDTLPPQAVTLYGTVLPATALAITTFPTLPAASPNAPYFANLPAMSGSPPYTWTVLSGALPNGLVFSSSGNISGTAASSNKLGSYPFTVQVTDSLGATASAKLFLPVALASSQANCNNIAYPSLSSPVLALTDLGTGTYLGEEGGLYPDGSNNRPAGHNLSGISIAQSIQPLDVNGNYDPNGKYVFLSIGMSETQQVFSQFLSDAVPDPSLNPHLVVINGAQDAIVASDWADISFGTWSTITNFLLPQAGLTANQVVAAWVKSLDNPQGTFPADELPSQSDLETIAQNLHTLFPNLQIAYFSTIIYGGYVGNGSGQSEPYPYQGGFPIKWAIEDQINGNPNLNFDPNLGVVMAPWMSWASYDWANGMVARGDGLVWTCSDYKDGVHPSQPQGREKDANLLLDFLKTDETARPWFLDPSKLVLLSKTAITFGNQKVGTTSNARTITLTANQGVPLNISAISTDGDFAQTNTCGSLVIAGGRCTISVTFTPTATGTRTGTLGITDDVGSSPQIVSLSGFGN